MVIIAIIIVFVRWKICSPCRIHHGF